MLATMRANVVLSYDVEEVALFDDLVSAKAQVEVMVVRIAELEAVLYAMASGDDVKDRIRSLLRR